MRSEWFKPVLLAALLGLPLPLYVSLRWDKITAEAQAAPCEIRVAGYALSPSNSIDGQLANLAREYLSGTVVIAAGAHQVRASRAALGAAIDESHLRALLVDLANPTSPMRLVHDQHRRGKTLHVPMPVRLEIAVARRQIQRLKDVLDMPAEPLDRREPADRSARGKPGRSLHLMQTLLRLQQALRNGQALVEPAVFDVPFSGDGSA